MRRKEKLVPLNITIPLSLREYAESVTVSEFDSLSDYIRTLIKRDQRRSAAEPLAELIDSIMGFLSRSTKNHGEVESAEALVLLREKLAIMSSLFDAGLTLRKEKIKRQNPKLSEKALLKKLNAWTQQSPITAEVPGLIEISEDRKKRLQNGK
jgi:hypothetical protein